MHQEFTYFLSVQLERLYPTVMISMWNDANVGFYLSHMLNCMYTCGGKSLCIYLVRKKEFHCSREERNIFWLKYNSKLTFRDK